MNYKELAENLGLEEDEYLELVELFIETSLSDLSNLKDAIDEKNLPQVVETTHSIKGAAGNMGFMEIFETAKDMEIKARKNSLAGAAEALGIIKEKFDLLSENFKAKVN